MLVKVFGSAVFGIEATTITVIIITILIKKNFAYLIGKV
jgi:hypothetical protein